MSKRKLSTEVGTQRIHEHNFIPFNEVFDVCEKCGEVKRRVPTVRDLLKF